MKFLIGVLIIRFIVALFTKNDSMNVDEVKNMGNSEDLHPAEFEMRDHFVVRCSE